jgi:hypothetical protein
MYKVGDRWIWNADYDGSSYKVKGYISEMKSPNSIIIKWQNGRLIQYNDYMIKEEPRLQIDKEYYRNQKLELLGI